MQPLKSGHISALRVSGPEVPLHESPVVQYRTYGNSFLCSIAFLEVQFELVFIDSTACIYSKTDIMKVHEQSRACSTCLMGKFRQLNF